jgi:hypothetical protein
LGKLAAIPDDQFEATQRAAAKAAAEAQQQTAVELEKAAKETEAAVARLCQRFLGR